MRVRAIRRSGGFRDSEIVPMALKAVSAFLDLSPEVIAKALQLSILQVLNIGDCVPPSEQMCMGFGVAAAIGAKLTGVNKKVVCITGDGAFQMLMKKMPTAARIRLR